MQTHCIISFFNHFVVFNEKEEFSGKLRKLHIDYYEKALNLANEQDMFNECIERDRQPFYSPTRIERSLSVKPEEHFGEAFKRLQSLFFMLRENEDVFQVFYKNAYRIRY